MFLGFSEKFRISKLQLRFGKGGAQTFQKLELRIAGGVLGRCDGLAGAEERHGMGFMDDEMGRLAGLGTDMCASLAGAELN